MTIALIQATHDAAAEALSFGDILWRVALALVLVLANGFFVAAEFALVGARKTRIEAMVRAGSKSAVIARNAILRLDHYLSADSARRGTWSRLTSSPAPSRSRSSRCCTSCWAS